MPDRWTVHPEPFEVDIFTKTVVVPSPHTHRQLGEQAVCSHKLGLGEKKKKRNIESASL